MNEPNKEFCWNFFEDSEGWSNPEDTIEGCLDVAIDQVKDFEECEDINEGTIKTVFIGEMKPYTPKISSYEIIDRIMDDAYDTCGEFAESWLDDITESEYSKLSSELSFVFDRWLKISKRTPTFGLIENIKEYDLKTGKQIKKEE